MIFDDLDQVIAAITADQRNLHLPIKQAYYVCYRPRKQNFNRIILECKYCGSHLYFNVTSDNKLLVTAARHTHFHTKGKFQSSLEETVYRMYSHKKIAKDLKSIRFLTK